MDREAIRTAALDTIRSIAPDADLERLRPDRPLREQLALDSLDWQNVIGAMGERLALDVPASDYGKLQTLDAIVDYVAARRAAPGVAPPRTRPPSPADLPRARHVVNGTPVELRPMGPDDAALEAEFVRRLSSDSRYQRFMVTLAELSPVKVASLTDVDQLRHVALAATAEREGRQALVGAARYIVDPAATDSCEFAVEVDDAWQGTGLAGILMGALIDVARSRGLRRMEGFVLAANRRMLKLTRQLGFVRERVPEAGDTVRVVRVL